MLCDPDCYQGCRVKRIGTLLVDGLGKAQVARGGKKNVSLTCGLVGGPMACQMRYGLKEEQHGIFN